PVRGGHGRVDHPLTWSSAMAVQTATSADGVARDINVLPLIDVLLVLVVVFFVLNMGFQFIPAQIPEAEGQSGKRDTGGQIVLELRDGGGFAINGQVIPEDQLETQLASIFDSRPTKLLFLKAADSRTYGEMVTAMDLARGAGVKV